jgi:hypothetical protein
LQAVWLSQGRSDAKKQYLQVFMFGVVLVSNPSRYLSAKRKLLIQLRIIFISFSIYSVIFIAMSFLVIHVLGKSKMPNVVPITDDFAVSKMGETQKSSEKKSIYQM